MKSQPGTYTVAINSQRSSFTVLDAGGAAKSPVSGGLIAIIVASLLVLVTAIVLIASRRVA